MSSSPSTTDGEKIEFYCPQCGGTDLTSDAACVWNVLTQRWEKHSDVYDDTHCNECGDEVKAKTRPYISSEAMAKAVRYMEQHHGYGQGAWGGAVRELLSKAREYNDEPN